MRSRSATSSTRPNGDPSNASQVAPDDPAWARAQLAGDRDLRQAQDRPEPVRLDRPQGERRGSRPRADRHGRQAPVLRQAPAASTRRSWRRSCSPASSRATSCRRSSRPSAGTSSRSCTARPTPTTSTDLKTQVGQGRGLRGPRPRQFGRHDREHRRGPRLGRQGPAEPGPDRRDLRGTGRQDQRGHDRRRRRLVPVQGLRRGDPDARGQAAPRS